MFSLADLPPRWTDEATIFRKRGREDLALFLESYLAELEAEMRNEENEPLTIAQAAAEGGYSEEHLRRLVREEQIPNAGRPNAPRIRRADVPKKPGRSVANRDAQLPSNGYNVDEDARGIAKRMGR